MKKPDRIILLVLLSACSLLVGSLITNSDLHKQHDLYKQTTDSLFAVTEKAHEAELAESGRTRDSVISVNRVLVANYLRVKERESQALNELKKVSVQKYQSLTAKQKQDEMIKRARE